MIGVGRAEAKSGQAAKRPMAATSGASLPRDVSVLSIVADLGGRDLNGIGDRASVARPVEERANSAAARKPAQHSRSRARRAA